MATGIYFDNAYTGPASYSTGGFTVTTGLSTVTGATVDIITPGANIGRVEFDLSFSGADVTVKVMRRNYDQLTSLGDMTGLPSGVSAASSSGQTYDNESSHIHTNDHDHAVTAPSSTMLTPSGGVAALVAGNNARTHTHTLNIPNFTGNTGTGGAHTHAWNNIYQHQHSITNTSTTATVSELSNGTNLSGTTLMIHAVGVE